MTIKQQYFNLLDEEYNKLPRDIGKKTKLSMERNKHHFVYIAKKGKLIAGLALIVMYKDIYCIHEVIVEKKHRNKGIGTRLMRQVHKRFKGIFILRTTNSEKFYLRLGYKSVGGKIMVFVNNKEMLRRDYLLKCHTNH